MARPLQSWELSLELAPVPAGKSDALPVFLRVARAIAADIRRGRLRAGARLPGSRELARSVGVHRNTVFAAYRELLAEGFLEAQRGRGTFVAAAIPEQPARRFGRAPAAAGLARQPGYPLSPAGTALQRYQPAPGSLMLLGGVPDVRRVPTAALARAYRRALQRPAVLHYGDARGLPALRSALASMLTASRGLQVGADDIVVTRGSQMAFSLAASALIAPGDVVAVEAPGYPPAWDTLRRAGARLAPIAVDAQGMRVDQLAELCRRERVRAVYVTPHHQYPTTTTLAAPRRLALLELARSQRFAILEDDYDHEFHYDGRPLLPLASADHAGVVIYIGTLSKVLAPSMRIGYVVAPAPLLERIVAARYALDRQGDHVTEHALASLFEDGEVQRHVRRTRGVYHARRDHCLEQLAAAFGDRLSWQIPSGGMALWTRVHGGVSMSAWHAHAASNGVVFQIARQLAFDGRDAPFARLGFGALDEREMTDAVQRLERAHRKARRDAGRAAAQ